VSDRLEKRPQVFGIDALVAGQGLHHVIVVADREQLLFELADQKPVELGVEAREAFENALEGEGGQFGRKGGVGAHQRECVDHHRAQHVLVQAGPDEDAVLRQARAHGRKQSLAVEPRLDQIGRLRLDDRQDAVQLRKGLLDLRPAVGMVAAFALEPEAEILAQTLAHVLEELVAAILLLAPHGECQVRAAGDEFQHAGGDADAERRRRDHGARNGHAAQDLLAIHAESHPRALHIFHGGKSRRRLQVDRMKKGARMDALTGERLSPALTSSSG